MFDMIGVVQAEGPPAVDDAAAVVRSFNQPDGIAHTMADDIDSAAVTTSGDLTPEPVVERFRMVAELARSTPHPSTTVL